LGSMCKFYKLVLRWQCVNSSLQRQIGRSTLFLSGPMCSHDLSVNNTVLQCEMPPQCAFYPDKATVYYWDAFETSLTQANLSMTRIYLGIFSHLPFWGKWLLVIRNKIVSVFGITGPSSAQLNDVGLKERYTVGEPIALFTLLSQNESEIVAGGKQKHLDFKVSLLRITEDGVSKIIVTTIVSPHNIFGKMYLFVILPFHRIGVKTLMARAVAAGRV